MRKHLGFSYSEWRAHPQILNDYYWAWLVEDLEGDPDSAENWDDWSDDPNVEQG